MSETDTLNLNDVLSLTILPTVLSDIVVAYTLPPPYVFDVVHEMNGYRELILDWVVNLIDVQPSHLFNILRPRRGSREYIRRQRWLLPY
jgi:hypothetical protein